MTTVCVTEITASSPEGYDVAIDKAYELAKISLENILSVWIKDQTIDIKQDKIMNYKVALKFAFMPLAH